MKLTIFTLPKPSISKHIDIIQQNAINSWAQLVGVQIIILGKGKGIAELAKSVDALYLPNIQTTKYGTPLLDDAFKQSREHATSPYLMYSNADMIYGPDLLQVISRMPANNFLVVGSRWDMDINNRIIYKNGWWKKLNLDRITRGVRHAPVGSDYFIYNKDSFRDLPPFAVGRVKWDNWMIYEARRSRMKTIDCSDVIIAIHQNHDYAHQLNQGKNYLSNPEARYNESLAKAVWRPFTLRDANWQMRRDVVTRKKYSWYERLLIVKDMLYGVVERLRGNT